MLTDQLNINSIPKHIFRVYDIRGVAIDELSEALVCEIGKVLGSMVQESGATEINLASDARLSSPALRKSLTQGILSSGCNICDLGITPTPLLYFATHVLNSNNGVMLTGSHNPKHHNGLKIILNGKSLTQTQVQEIYQRVKDKNYIAPNASTQNLIKKQAITQVINTDLSGQYIKRITEAHLLPEKQIPKQKPRRLKVVIDAGNGAASELAPKLFKALNCDATELFCEFDGNFPNHHPDPSKAENLQALIKTVLSEKADIGLAFDGDADRLGVITNTGEIIWPDRQMMLYAQQILKESPNCKIVFDVKCSKNLSSVIQENGGTPIMYKTGHSLLKAEMIRQKAQLAGEMSGHIFFKHKWYGFDDALYTATRLLEILANTDRTSEQLFKQFPDLASTPELNLEVPEEKKFQIMQILSKNSKIYHEFKNANIITIDGLRVEFEHGWGLVRASNTTACLVIRFEANTKKDLSNVQDIFKDFILKYCPALNQIQKLF